MAATACAAPLALRAAAVAPTRGVRSGVGKMAPRPRHRRAVRSAAVATASGARNQKPATLGSTFTTWLLKEEVEGRVDGELAIVLSSVALACKQIASQVQRAGISGMTDGRAAGPGGAAAGETRLDEAANRIFCDVLRASGRTGVIASAEAEDAPVAVESYGGNYVVVFDPLDGSSNVAAAVSTGSIFGVYASDEQCVPDFDADPAAVVEEKCIANVCQPGRNLTAAGYCMYSSSTILVLTVGDGAFGFTLDPSVGEFIMSHERITVPESGKIYSMNEGKYGEWEEGVQKYADSLKTGGPERGSKAYSARYIGALVADFHRTMLYGGIYGYPADAANPRGKLRLLYECTPMAFIAEQCGGMGSTGRGRVLDVVPEGTTQRVPFFVGSPKEVLYLESFLE